MDFYIIVAAAEGTICSLKELGCNVFTAFYRKTFIYLIQFY